MQTISKGLEGVVAARTAICDVQGEAGRLIYRGYEIEDLAEHASFEEVCHLLWLGELPTRVELRDLSERLATSRPLDQSSYDVLNVVTSTAHPMDALRTGISALGCTDPDAASTDAEATLRTAIRATSQAATMTAAIFRFRNGQQPVAPRLDLGHAASFLYMLRGEVPDPAEARALDAAFTLHAEHSLNASTFSARVTVATLADLYAGVTSAIGTLKGPLHGGANQGVMEMLLEIGSPDRAESWVRSTLDAGGKIAGFGHRVYRTLDPRAPILKRLAERLGGPARDTRWLAISERIQTAMREEMSRRGKKVHPNVDFFSASLYYTLGIPIDMFTNIFACARMPGWTAHIREQFADNRLIRPAADYVGETGRSVQPIEERGS
ncbi:MAG: citrate/2-methylcitrate synthase [Longimicrobiales bacterium]